MNGKKNNTLRLIGTLLILIIFVFAMGACQGATSSANEDVANEPVNQPVDEAVDEPTDEPTTVPPAPTDVPDQSMYHAAWESSSHSLYDLGHGPNTWCARCHSPQNWDPEAIVGPPPSCMTCKFPTDDEVRIAPGNDLILEEDWAGVNCDTCHEVDDEGIASEEIAWLNPVSMEYIPVNTSTELCEKCHVTTTGNAFGSGVDHKITLGGSAHLNYGGFLGDVPPPQYCADCHDPHTLEPKECEDCHDVAAIDNHIKGKGALHEIVTCMACHDAEGYDVGPHPDEDMGGIWVTQLTTMGRGGPSTEAITSHSIVYTVACDRCHFADNPWGRTEFTEEGEIPEVDICVNGETLTVEKPTLDDYGMIDKDYTLGECPTD